MSTQILAQPIVTLMPDVQYAVEFMDGKDLWAAGKPISACSTEAQRDGWQEAEDKGADAYLHCLIDAAHDGEEVDWDGVTEVLYNAWGDIVR